MLGTYQRWHYHGAAMGSPISPLIANLFMEEFEVKALMTAPQSPHLWLRFVDDTFVIQKAEHSQQFLHHINTQDLNIQFTVEEPEQHGSLPFIDTKITSGPNNTHSTTVYRIPTHTDQYLHWNSNHFITAKHSVYNTLAHRAKGVSSDQQSLHQKLEYISMALQNFHSPKWALNKLQQNFQCRQHNHNETTSTDQQNSNTTNSKEPTSTTLTTKTSTRWFPTYRE